uniref:Uncharacterized protein n=1 Tax=viral metagenome TaxID=1070528 RepID=A0A6H1ZH42_9ZZZZ
MRDLISKRDQFLRCVEVIEEHEPVFRSKIIEEATWVGWSMEPDLGFELKIAAFDHTMRFSLDGAKELRDFLCEWLGKPEESPREQT